jgi:4-carboxymuconolactone decarboxylase
MPRKRPAPRLATIKEAQMTEPQRALLAALRAGPRGKSLALRGPFAAWMHAPELGELAQRLGAHCRFRTRLAKRLSEFAILCTARMWRAQFEWYAHAPMAADAGVKPKTIADIKAGRMPKAAPKDERAIYAFVQELYRKRRVSAATYKRVQSILGDAATVELVGILGYYVLISMTLNVFHMLPPESEKLPFAELK